MARYFVFTFDGTDITARARLNEAHAPKTCEMLWAALPYARPCRHGIYSGTATAIHIDSAIVPPKENATLLVQRGDVMFTHYDAYERHGHPDALSEIYWAYDRYCAPRMPGGLAPVMPNVFGEFLPGAEGFFETCAAIRFEGPKAITITGASD